MFQYEEPLFRPPSEASSLIFQITVGCSQNSCTFCGMYKHKQFRLRPVSEIVAEIESIPKLYQSGIRRVFLADGDALVYPQEGLMQILDHLATTYPNLARVGAYASPNSLTTKNEKELAQLRDKKLRILYFGLESGDNATLKLVNKGYAAPQMLELCRKAQSAGIKLSITAILGLGGQDRTVEHAAGTADWINLLSPEYFSLLTLFSRHNLAYFEQVTQQTRGEILEEALAIVKQLHPARTILRSNHASNFLNLAGSYPKDRARLIADVESAIATARRHPDWYQSFPDYSEAY
ncbi:MAG: B12-binding domain-containing radical SAM protein [Desulfuromonadales bacterium]|nr:B12-binding domain-containing radical SAM protein [Desulfuromonadales bacterium]